MLGPVHIEHCFALKQQKMHRPID